MNTHSSRFFDSNTKLDKFDYIVLTIISAYLLIDLFPIGGIRNAETQIFYINILNILVAGAQLFYPGLRKNHTKQWFKGGYLMWAYFAFVTFCGLSIFVANNQIVSIYRFTQIIIIFTAFLNVFILLKNRIYLLYQLCFIVGVIALIQAGIVLEKINLTVDGDLSKQVKTYLRGNAGNVNVFSASMLFKIPFIVVGIIYIPQKWKKKLLSFAMFLTTAVVFFINARASLLTLILLSIIFFIYFYKQTEKKSFIISRGIYIILPLIASLLFTQYVKGRADSSGRYGSASAVDRLQEINTESAGAQARLKLWGNAIKMSKKNPITGYGIGNWSIEATPYEPPKRNNFSLHAHNDFFELLAEIGVFGAATYFSIFIFILVVNLKRFFKSNKADEQMLALLALMLLISYGVDATFNFPLYRPTMQLGFLLLLVITMINSASIKENDLSNKINLPYKVSGVILLMLAIAPIYVSFYSYKTMMLETKIYHDPVHKDITLKPKMTADEIISLTPKFPNILLTSTGSYEEYIGTLYYVNDDFDNALRYFRKANKINPYIGKSDFYTYYIYKKRKENDSAYHYLKSSFYRRAWSIDIYKILLKEMIKRKDTVEILQSYQHFNTIHESPEALNLTIHALSSAQYDNKQLFSFIDKEKNTLNQLDLEVNIDSLLSKAQSDIGTRLMAQRKKEKAAQAFEKAISLDSTNYTAIQSLGLYYSGKKDYDKSIILLKKSLKNPNLKDNGRTEFIIGLSYSAKYDLVNACKYLKIAKEKNYPKAERLYNRLSCSD